MGKFSEPDVERQVIERLRAPATLSAPCGNVVILGKLAPAPDNTANRAAWQRRKAMAQADRLAGLHHVLAAGRAT